MDIESDEPVRLSREELYELVWSEPAQQLASRLGNQTTTHHHELSLVALSVWQSRSKWSDGKRELIEEKLPEFFATLEIRAAKDEERELERERERKA